MPFVEVKILGADVCVWVGGVRKEVPNSLNSVPTEILNYMKYQWNVESNFSEEIRKLQDVVHFGSQGKF